jgi:tetratricopeptide (TPR) repeat protein
MKGRTIFGDLVPYDKIWRTGANSGSKITFSDAVKLQGKDVPAGTYTLYTKPGKSTWTVMLYKDNRLGGNVAGYDEANELTRFTVSPQTLPFKVETMSFMVGDLTDNGANIYLMWEDVAVVMGLEVEVDKMVMASIDRTMAGPSSNDYYQAAVYYYNADKDMNKALSWINKSLEGGERYWIMTWKARILAKMGNKSEAIATSKKAIALAEEAKNEDYIKINKDLIASLQ